MVVISNSARVNSELQFAARGRLQLTHCCSQATHISKADIQGSFPQQEAVDLFLLARARRIVASVWGFAVLGRYWMGRQGAPELIQAKSQEEVRQAMRALLVESGCEGVE